MAGRATYAFVAAAAMATPPADASPWTRPVGDLFVASTIDYFRAATGPAERFRRLDTSTYAEFGLSERTALGAKVVYGTSWTERPDGTLVETGFSEIEAYAQRTIQRGGRGTIAARIGVIAPARLGSGVRAGLASDGLTAEARALYGRTLLQRPVRIFVGAESAFRRNFGSGADEARGDIVLGLEPSRRFLFLLESLTTVSLQNAEPGGSDYDLYKGQASIVVRTGRRFRVQAGFNHEFRGRNVVPGDSIFISFWSEF
jgi:hypothetical protein